MSERLQGGSTTYCEVFANALYLVLLNVGNSITQIRYMAEVDTTGRYNYALPAVCRRLTMPSMHTFWGIIYTNGVGIEVCLFI